MSLKPGRAPLRVASAALCLLALVATLAVASAESSARPTGFPKSFYTGPAGSNVILPTKRGVLLGTAQTGSYASVKHQLQALEATIGRKLDIEHRYMQGTCSLDRSLVRAIVKRGHIPMISWLPSTRNGGAIMRGDADTCIRTFGRQIAAQPHRILLRPYWEFNGDWYEHSKDLDGSLLTADEHKAMWRRSIDRLRDGGAFPKASVVWCPGEGHYGNGDSFDEDTAYPGDSYVDWVCSDGYNMNSPDSWCGSHAGWCEFSEIFTHGGLVPGVEQAFRNRKPFMVGETGSVEGSAEQKREWFLDIRKSVKLTMPGMLGLVYFDVSYANQDWRIGTSESALNGFRSLAASPHFNTRPRSLGARPSKPTAKRSAQR